jgi:hypothetical protein
MTLVTIATNSRRGRKRTPFPRGAQAASGRPFMVHLNGLAMTRLKYPMNASILAFRSALEEKSPRRMTLRTRIENQISIWLSHEACFGVKWNLARIIHQRNG